MILAAGMHHAMAKLDSETSITDQQSLHKSLYAEKSMYIGEGMNAPKLSWSVSFSSSNYAQTGRIFLNA